MTKLTTTEYGSLMDFLAHIRAGKDLEEIASRFNDDELNLVLDAIDKIKLAIQVEVLEGESFAMRLQRVVSGQDIEFGEKGND